MSKMEKVEDLGTLTYELRPKHKLEFKLPRVDDGSAWGHVSTTVGDTINITYTPTGLTYDSKTSTWVDKEMT